MVICIFYLSIFFSISNTHQSWDVFKTVSRKSETIYETTTNWFEVAAKSFKIFIYVFLFVCVLASAISSKASLLLMTNAIGHGDQVSNGNYNYFFITRKYIINLGHFTILYLLAIITGFQRRVCDVIDLGI